MRLSRRYEQDWLDDEFDRFGPLTQSATLATVWLQQMAAGAAKSGLTIQCALPTYYLLLTDDLRVVT